MKRAPMARVRAPQVMMEEPTLRPLTFAPLALQTHPIDTYDGPQGWGPFYGPWTPWDFHDPAAHIAYTYGHGESNDWQFAPPYEITTLFQDRSLEWVFNTSYDVEAQHAERQAEIGYTSTISNQVPAPGSFLTRLRAVLRGE